MAARCDWQFSWGEAVDVKIVQKILEDCCPNTSFAYWDPHCNVRKHACRYEAVEVYYALEKFPFENYRLCFPDEGAAERLGVLDEANDVMHGRPHSFTFKQKLWSHCQKVKPIICRKVRGENGITVKPQFPEGKNKKPILVVDDLCDGGGTFVALQHMLYEQQGYNIPELNLFVTHAIQAEGIVKVADCYDNVYITDSYKDWMSYMVLPTNVNVIEL